MPKACKSNDKHCKSNEQGKRTHDMKQTDIARLGQENAIEMIGKEWMLVTAGSADHFNTMTASWGGLGFLWNKPVAFVFVRPERYTHDFIEANDRLTLAFLGEEGRDALKYCGSHSGRDADKMAATGLTPLTVADDAVTFAQARLTLVCRKLYKDAMRAEAFIDKACLERWYNDQPGGGLHDVYVVEIEAVYER